MSTICGNIPLQNPTSKTQSVLVTFTLNEGVEHPKLKDFREAVFTKNPPMDGTYWGVPVLQKSEQAGNCEDDSLGSVHFIHQVTGGNLLIYPRHYIAAVWSEITSNTVSVSSQMVATVDNAQDPNYQKTYSHWLAGDDDNNILTAYNAAKWTYNMTQGIITYVVSADAGGILPATFQGGIEASSVLPKKILEEYLQLIPDRDYTVTASKPNEVVSLSD